MRFTIIVLCCLLFTGSLFARERNIASNKDDVLLLIKEGKVYTGKKVLYTLKGDESVMLSPNAGFFSVLSAKKVPGRTGRELRILERNGKIRYQVKNTDADWVYVADNGASVLVTILGMDINSKVRIEIYDSSGHKSGFVVTAFPGECKFFPGNSTFAISIRGESTRVFDIKSGKQLYKIPYARTFVTMKENRILLVDRFWFAYFNSGREVWRRSHQLYYPRLTVANDTGDKVIVGCHHEVAMVDVNNGNMKAKWNAPANFGIISIDASKDFSTVAAGLRSLKKIEAVCMLDKDLKLLQKQERHVKRATRIFPQVAILEKPRVKVHVFGQSWEKTLERKRK